MTNSTFRACPWADGLFAMDRDWWIKYRQEVDEIFRGERFSSNKLSGKMRVTHVPIKAHSNSGIGAIATALAAGADKVILVGYDCQHTGGQTHWHGDHPRGLGNAAKVDKWPEKFKLFKAENGKANIINASRETALTMFPRMTLEDALC